MNVRIECNATFSAGLVWQGEYMINNFVVSAKLITQTTDSAAQNIALERLKYMLYTQFQHGVFVSENEKDSIKKLRSAGLKVFVLPLEAVDQIIGMMLYCKLSAVMEGRLGMTELSIRSDLGDNIIYFHNEREEIGPFTAEGWWHNVEPICQDTEPQKGKVVALSAGSSWQSLGFDWESLEEEEVDDSKIVVAFKKDD